MRNFFAEKTIDLIDFEALYICDYPREVAEHVTSTAMKRYGLSYGGQDAPPLVAGRVTTASRPREGLELPK